MGHRECRSLAIDLQWKKTVSPRQNVTEQNVIEQNVTDKTLPKQMCREMSRNITSLNKVSPNRMCQCHQSECARTKHIRTILSKHQHVTFGDIFPDDIFARYIFCPIQSISIVCSFMDSNGTYKADRITTARFTPASPEAGKCLFRISDKLPGIQPTT